MRLSWLGTAAAIVGAAIIALNVGVTWLGFAVFLVASVSWLVVGMLRKDGALVVMQAAFTAINLLGLYRWG